MIFAGNPGSGKTLQSLKHKDGMETPIKKIIIDIENKATSTYQVNKKKGNVIDDIEIFNPLVLDKKYDIDYVETFKKLTNKLDDIKKNNNYDVIVIDSINYLRNPLCAEYYKQLNNKKGIVQDAWRHVNEYVYDLLMPLAQYCRVRNKTLIIICHLKDYYENDVYVKKIPNIKEWAEHLGDIILLFESNMNTYRVKCIRSAGEYWEDDISGNQCIDILLEERGLI